MLLNTFDASCVLFIHERKNVCVQLEYIKTLLCPSCRKAKIFLKTFLSSLELYCTLRLIYSELQ